MSSDACAKSTGAIASGHGGGMTISFASYRCSSMGDRPAVREQAQRVRRAAGRVLERARVPGGQHVGLAGTELDGMRDRRVVRDAAGHQLPVRPPHGREPGGDRGTGDHRVEERTGGKQAAPRP